MSALIDLRCPEHHGSGRRCVYPLCHGPVLVEGELKMHGDGAGHWWGDVPYQPRHRALREPNAAWHAREMAALKALAGAS